VGKNKYSNHAARGIEDIKSIMANQSPLKTIHYKLRNLGQKGPFRSKYFQLDFFYIIKGHIIYY